MGGGPEREKVCPARSQHPKFGVFALAGRSFSRKRGWRPAAGRVFSRAGSRGPGCWALLLAVLTLQCAAKPHWWHGGQPAHATTHRVNVHRMRSQKWGLLGSQASAPPGIRQRRDPEGSRLSLRAVVVPPAPETQCPSLSSETTAAVESGANAQFFHQPLTVSMACVPRSDSALWALTRPEDRRAAWKREATFSQFTRFHQALT